MGYQHGMAYCQEIITITKERVALSGDSQWTGRQLSRTEVLDLAAACLPAHHAYTPNGMAELQGMADATSLSLPELIIANGFTDFIDVIYELGPRQQQPIEAKECTAFLIPSGRSQGGQGFLAQSWDMHASATPHVILLRGQPNYDPAFYAFSITGCLGMIGMNEAGIAVGINNLLGRGGQAGVMWTFVCREVLRQTNLDEALACITQAPLAGAHNYLLMDASGRGYNIEAMPNHCHVTELGSEALIHTNQCLHPDTQARQRPLTERLIQDSAVRWERAAELLNRDSMTPDDVMAVLRDRQGEFSICASCHWEEQLWETCCAAIMRPASREVWGVWGLPAQNPFQRFTF
jgi:isopenicillin-N N-acyltransferase-like protein